MVMPPSGYDPNAQHSGQYGAPSGYPPPIGQQGWPQQQQPQQPVTPQWAPNPAAASKPAKAPKPPKAPKPARAPRAVGASTGSALFNSLGKNTRISLGLIAGGVLLYFLGVIAASDRFDSKPWLQTTLFVIILGLLAAAAASAAVLLDRPHIGPGGLLAVVLLLQLLPGTSFVFWLGTALHLKFLVGDAAVELTKPWSAHSLCWAFGSLAILLGAIHGRQGEPSPVIQRAPRSGTSAFAPRTPQGQPSYQQPVQQSWQQPASGYQPQAAQPPAQPQWQPPTPQLPAQPPYAEPPAAPGWPAAPQQSRPAPAQPQQHSAQPDDDDEVDEQTIRRKDLPRDL